MNASEINANALRCGRISARYWAWEAAWNKAAKHQRGCRVCRRDDSGNDVPCPMALPFPPLMTSDQLSAEG